MKDGIGIGIKTFLNGNGKTLQKIAEFNKYHCIVRESGKIKVFECNMDEVAISDIKRIKVQKNTISFEDGLNEYSFNISKSTLYKRFYTENVLLDIDVDIVEEPYKIIRNILTNDEINNKYVVAETSSISTYGKIEDKEFIFLPLYSVRKGKKYVPEKSNLNQWNASGRERHFDETYIQIPSWINKFFPEFFLPRKQNFKLILPDGKELSAKVCQANSKALMTNPNKDLGKWLLRGVMNLREGELLTYERLEEIGIDSVVIYKESNDVYTINFTELGSFEEFQLNSLANINKN